MRRFLCECYSLLRVLKSISFYLYSSPKNYPQPSADQHNQISIWHCLPVYHKRMQSRAFNQGLVGRSNRYHAGRKAEILLLQVGSFPETRSCWELCVGLSNAALIDGESEHITNSATVSFLESGAFYQNVIEVTVFGSVCGGWISLLSILCLLFDLNEVFCWIYDTRYVCLLLTNFRASKIRIVVM